MVWLARGHSYSWVSPLTHLPLINTNKMYWVAKRKQYKERKKASWKEESVSGVDGWEIRGSWGYSTCITYTYESMVGLKPSIMCD